MKHTDASATLRSINEVLRRAEDLHWTDPAFLEWEREQVGDVASTSTIVERNTVITRWTPGTDAYDEDDGHCIRPMIEEADPGRPTRPMTIRARDYTHGLGSVDTSWPLMLGPEPEKVEAGESLVFFRATPDLRAFTSLARRLHLPHATEEGLRAFAMHRQSGFARGGVITPVGIANGDFRRHPDLGQINAAAAAINRFSDDLIASVASGTGVLAPLMPEPPYAEDVCGAALERRQQSQPWHAFTAGPQNQRRTAR